DIATDSELLSDSFPMKEVDGILYEVECAMITVGGESFDTGANASAEEGGEDLDDNVKKVNNIIHTFQLQDIPLTKADYKNHVKSFIKKVKKHMDETNASAEDKEAFKTKGQAFIMKVLKNFGDYECYVGEAGPSENDDQQVLLLNYREDGVTPYFTVWKHGLSEMKV
ncbi:translationally-controlled tumor protein, partial [Xylariales sp. AK1849]